MSATSFASFDNFAECFPTAHKYGIFHRVWAYHGVVFIQAFRASGHQNTPVRKPVSAFLAPLEAAHGPWGTWKPSEEDGFDWLQLAIENQHLIDHASK